MAHFLRAKQAGVQNDLSQGIAADFFMLDDLARYGINSQISTFAYDPVQSLLAVGTNDSHFAPAGGQIYIFGIGRVCVTFNLQKRASIREIQFCGDKVVVFDSRNDITIFSLETKKRIAHYTPPGQATAFITDPSLDYCLTGLQSGEIVAYDVDRESMTPFRIGNLWRMHDPRSRIATFVCLQYHPKDVGTLLIGYSEGAVIYSFKQNKALKFFHYELPAGAPGGNSDPRTVSQIRHPKLTHALWHPTGTFVLTAHEDSSLVFWDPRDGRVLEARTIEDVAINMPGNVSIRPGSIASSLKAPYQRLFWCSKQNPDDTGLLIAGGNAVTTQATSLSFIDFGPTPNYQTSTWEALTAHFRNPKRTHILPTPPNIRVSELVLIPRSSPHYNGCHDPIAIVVAMASGEILTLSFPNGHPIPPTNHLHVSLFFVHPFITKMALTDVDRPRWLGMRELREHGPPFLLGGAGTTKPMKRFEGRNIVQTAHADGSIRLWDVGHGDEIENESVMQVDLARAIGRYENLAVSQMAMSGSTGEFVAGMETGEVVVFRLNRNISFGRPSTAPTVNAGPGSLTDISKRGDPALKEGLMPLTLVNEEQGSVTALALSKVGFLAVGYQSGGLVVLDLRGPAIIHTAVLSSLEAKRSGRSHRHSVSTSQEWPTVVEFGVMTLDDDNYSSIGMFVGTNLGRVLTFKILPSASGRYTVQYAGQSALSEDRVVSINAINADTGASAEATGAAVVGLQSGQKVTGVLVVTTQSSAHIFRPASAKGASKSFDNIFCDAATVSRFEQRGYALVGVFGDGTARAYSIPALREVGCVRLDRVFDVKRLSESLITTSGDILGWTGPSEVALVSVWGAGSSLPVSEDRLWDPAKVAPARPTISNLQWIAGTQYITPADMDILIGGPGRPPSKRMLAEERAQRESEFQRQREAARTGRPPPPAPEQEGYWAYMQRQIQERTENLGLAGDSMDKAAEASSSWSDGVSKYIAKQKRQAALGLIGGKLGL